MRRRRRYYEPEDLGAEQDRRDAAIPNRRYYVYVLDTDYGHYVGHTAHVGRRFREHQDGETESTAGTNPELAWTSGPLKTRADAARFEAAMKALRDKRAPRFEEITGLDPSPSPSPLRIYRRGLGLGLGLGQANHRRGGGGWGTCTARQHRSVLTRPRPLRAGGYTRKRTVADTNGDDRDE